MMKVGISLLLAIITASVSTAQIDMRDSTVQAIAYWKMGETQRYQITESEVSSTQQDTLSKKDVLYTATVEVSDSTSYGYLLTWTRSDYKTQKDTSFSSKLKTVLAGYPVLVTTDIYGSSPSVLNWEKISTHVETTTSALKLEYRGNDTAIAEIEKVAKWYTTQDLIDQRTIRDIQQLLAYHGALYKLGEPVTTQDKIVNNYGGDPLDATTALVLDEILPDNATYVIKTFQNINPQQLKAVTYDYLSKVNVAEGAMPRYEDFPTIMKQIYGGAEIHGPTGWVIYSQETEQVTSGEDITTKERLIELLR